MTGDPRRVLAAGILDGRAVGARIDAILQPRGTRRSRLGTRILLATLVAAAIITTGMTTNDTPPPERLHRVVRTAQQQRADEEFFRKRDEIRAFTREHIRNTARALTRGLFRRADFSLTSNTSTGELMKALRSLALSVCLLIACVAHAQTCDVQLREFEAFAETQLASAHMAGLSVAVMKDDFVWSHGFGFADVENRIPATAESSYRLASVTKPMTAVAVLKLAEEGRIDLDAEVQKYVPSFPKKPWPITVRQLLAHLGGISHYRDLAAEQHFREPKNTAESLAVFRDFDLKRDCRCGVDHRREHDEPIPPRRQERAGGAAPDARHRR